MLYLGAGLLCSFGQTMLSPQPCYALMILDAAMTCVLVRRFLQTRTLCSKGCSIAEQALLLELSFMLARLIVFNQLERDDFLGIRCDRHRPQLKPAVGADSKARASLKFTLVAFVSLVDFYILQFQFAKAGEKRKALAGSTDVTDPMQALEPKRFASSNLLQRQEDQDYSMSHCDDL